MDLVDIDQVLDNLELRIAADERRNAVAATTVASAESRPLGDGAASSSSSAGASCPTAGNTKNFVGVSQVFNSLDDYRNNVKSLETATTQKYEWHLPEADEDPAKEDEDALNQQDIHKYSEALEKQQQQPIVSSSESLTTSSCSTFSSGPSPGNASDTNSEELESEKPSALEVVPLPESASVLTNVAPVAAVEDLAVGLSSISITNTTESRSMLPCEVTASSALGQVLNELSAETNELETQKSPDEKEEGVSHVKTQSAIQPLQQEHIQQERQEQMDLAERQPITFCSTMDEISDTELDMLQEIDDIEEEHDEQLEASRQRPEEVTVKSTTIDSNNGLQQVDDDDDCVSDSPVTEEESVRILSEQDSTSGDQMNVDNFSQASTVEFADLRATPVTAMGGDELASSFSSSSESSLSGRKLDNDNDEEHANGSLYNEIANDSGTKSAGEIEDSMAATDALETQEQQRPQRPNTLDLNGCQTQVHGCAGQTPNTEAENNGVLQEQQEPSEIADTSATGDESPIYEAVGYSDDPHANLGKVPPIWVPDNMANGCMQCQQKFTMIKRRHHCRACGKVLCSICCSQRFHLAFTNEPESRVCVQCFMILTEREGNDSESQLQREQLGALDATAGAAAILPPTPMRSPNPNNPMEYCSTIPPHRQVNATPGAPPSVIVPVGVLKKTDSSSNSSSNSSGQKARKRKSVMFSDGIAPGSELASTMEQQWGEAKQARRGHHSDRQRNANKPPTPGASAQDTRSIDSTTMGLVAQLFRGSIPPSAAAATLAAAQAGSSNETSRQSGTQNSPRRRAELANSNTSKRLPPNADAQGCFIPYEEHALPPICVSSSATASCDYEYKQVRNDAHLLERLQRETLKFIVKNNFYVLVKVANLNCCMNCWVMNFTTSGLHHVGNDELIILLELKLPLVESDEPVVPRDIFQHLCEIYVAAEHAQSVVELGFSSPSSASFLGSREYGGFLYIRPTYQCLQNVILPPSPYLVGVLIHRHEVPWAKVLPLRLMLRLGAQYRYYPCTLISVRNRESVYGEIAQTIVNFLADFRNYTYSLPSIRGLYIHMEDRQTTVEIPRYRQNDVIKAINNASDHVLAFAGNFSKVADGHLVCMQNMNDERSEMYAYSTQAINIQGQPRKVTGASFFLLNESLKSSSGLSGKCSIVEDGLMVQVLPTKMEEVRNALRNQTDINIVCGPISATEEQSEIVSIKWVDNDRDINVGVKSPIDEQAMDGVANIRVHATFNYSNANYTIRLTDIFILKCVDWYETNGANFSSITRIAEQLATSASMALLPFLDLLAAAGISKIGLRATLDQENVCYDAGARGTKLPPLYMNALDNHLIPTLHAESSGIEEPIVLEMIFYILNA